MKEKFVVLKGIKMPKNCKECYYYLIGNCSFTKELLKDISVRGEKCPLINIEVEYKSGGSEFNDGYNFALENIDDQLRKSE